MKYSLINFIIIIIIIVIPSIAEADNVLTLTDKKTEFHIREYLYYIEDKTADLTISDILSNEKKWIHSTEDKLNFGFTKSVYWFKFTVINKSQEHEWILLSKYPLLDMVSFYQPSADGGYEEKKSGDRIPFSQRIIQDRAITFYLSRKMNNAVTYYVKVQSESNLNCNFILIRDDSFNRTRADEKFWFGIFFGIILVICLYNFLIFIKINDKNYIFYILFVLNHGLFQMQYHGLSLQYLWPEYPQWNNIALNFFGGQAICWVVLFTRSFLQTDKNAKIIDKALLLFLIPGLFQLITSFFLPYSIPAQVGTITLMVFPLALWLTGFIVYRSGYRPARFYLMAWSLYLLFVTIWSLSRLAILETNVLTEYGMQIGSAIEAVLLSLALGDRMNILAAERINAQKALIEEQEESLNIQKQYTESFARFVPQEFLQFLKRDNIIKVELGDQVMREMTVLFSDIRSFTSISEKMSPQENINFLNDFLGQISPAIRNNKGFIDKFIGDAIMALFPGRPDDAIFAAIEMLNQLEKMNENIKDKIDMPVEIGVGIHTGNLMLGTIGEPHRLETTVISDTVNIASRLESLNKKLDTNIIISMDSFKKCENPGSFQNRRIGRVKLKGKESSVEILEIIYSHH